MRKDDGDASHIEGDKVIEITGPGPIIFQAEYEKYKFVLTYHVEGDSVYGIPAGGAAPADMTGIEYDTDVTLAPDAATGWKTSKGPNGGADGTWKFTGWSTDASYGDDLEIKNIKKNETVYGKWAFIPDTYKLIYEVAGDKTYGIPADSIVPAEVDGIDYDTNVTLAPDATTGWKTSKGPDGGKKGTWKFTGWCSDTAYTDNLEIKNIKKNETVYGKWTFVPQSSGGSGSSGSSGGAGYSKDSQAVGPGVTQNPENPGPEAVAADSEPGIINEDEYYYLSVLGASGRRLPQTGTTYVLASVLALVGVAMLFLGRKKKEDKKPESKE